MDIAEDERAEISKRPTQIDYACVDGLHYLGNYVRPLSVNLARMMENAYDWEHLPFVHPGAFSDIAEISSGRWGWRAKVETPPLGSGQYQLLELLVDAPNHYWATTVVSGAGEGTQIHTQASATGKDTIEVDVRFYLPEAPDDQETADIILKYLQDQYAGLYDEDLDLMQARQSALDRRKDGLTQPANGNGSIQLGSVDEIRETLPLLVETPKGRICLNRWNGAWHVYSAECPHQLGPLEDAEVDGDGCVTCPWHGYRFNIATGKNCDGKTAPLAKAYIPVEQDGQLILEPTEPE